jgi:hypothetical protein
MKSKSFSDSPSRPALRPTAVIIKAFASVALFAVLAGTISAHAQTAPLPIGTATVDADPGTCLPSDGWLSGGACTHYKITGCANAQPLGVTINFVPATQSKGTIVFFSGGAGTSATTPAGLESTFAAAYSLAGYSTIQTAWDDDWELTNIPADGNPQFPPSILAAACRPATLMYIINNSSTYHPSGAMCAQGASAGGGGVAYALVWYGAKQYLTNVELPSAPPFASILQGCKVPNYGPVTVCSSTQYGCNNEYGTTNQWTNKPQYIDPNMYLGSVQTWVGGGSVGDTSCNNAGMVTTLPSSNQAWLNMSIVDPPGGDFDFLNYTSMAIWACAGPVSNYQTGTCGNAHCPNNSGSEAGLFGQNFSMSNHPTHYAFTGINQCNQEEGVAATGAMTPNGMAGMAAIQLDMTTYCK